MFDSVLDRAEMIFVEYERNWGDGLSPELYRRYGELTTWEDHRSADALLDAVDPDRVVMIAITSRSQVALRVAARERGIEVIHLEHGYRHPFETQVEILDRVGQVGPRSTLRGHRFFAGSLMHRSPGTRRALLRYAWGTRRGVSLSLLDRSADIRRADRYISFSPECFDFHRRADRIDERTASRTVFTGVPQFDRFAEIGDPNIDAKATILIDHQLHSGGYFGWSVAARREWARALHAAIREAGRTLYVKEHPGDASGTWQPYLGRGVELIRDMDELAGRLRSTRLVLGIASTLQLPLAGLDHVAHLTLEIHPRDGHLLSQRFVDAGVAEPITSFEELPVAIARADQIHERQRPHKPAFVRRFLHRLDGGAGKRMERALLGPG
jgi:hypothetical protein